MALGASVGDRYLHAPGPRDRVQQHGTYNNENVEELVAACSDLSPRLQEASTQRSYYVVQNVFKVRVRAHKDKPLAFRQCDKLGTKHKLQPRYAPCGPSHSRPEASAQRHMQPHRPRPHRRIPHTVP